MRAYRIDGGGWAERSGIIPKHDTQGFLMRVPIGRMFLDGVAQKSAIRIFLGREHPLREKGGEPPAKWENIAVEFVDDLLPSVGEPCQMNSPWISNLGIKIEC